MKNSIWDEPVEHSSTLFTKPRANIGQVGWKIGEKDDRHMVYEKVFVTFNRDNFDIFGAFETPDSRKPKYLNLNISYILSANPALEVVGAIAKDISAATMKTRDFLLGLAIKRIVPTLPDDLQTRGAGFKKEELLEALKRAETEKRETPQGEKVSKKHGKEK